MLFTMEITKMTDKNQIFNSKVPEKCVEAI